MGLSGVQRVTKLVKYLARDGWTVDVLTVRPGGYFAFDESLMEDLAHPGITIHRTGSLDPTRLFGAKRRITLPAEGKRRLASAISQFLFQPDNKVGWIPFAVRRGRKLMREHSYAAVLASAPPYSALVAARTIARRGGVPFVADFRDDWMGNPRHVYPTPFHRLFSRRLERRVLESAEIVFAINRTIADSLSARAPGARSVGVMPQGFDPEDFQRAAELTIDSPGGPSSDSSSDSSGDSPGGSARGRFRLLYTGVFYDAQRPDTFLQGLARFRERRPEAKDRVEARFVGLMPDSGLRLSEELGLADVVDIRGYLPHVPAVRELVDADVAWMVVGDRPGAESISTGKLFEYMGSRTPILALVPDGEAAGALRGYGAERICRPDDPEAVAGAIEELYDLWESGELPTGRKDHADRYDRRLQARQIGEMLRSL
jgi:glycosyltransferase involved in cell wall biosynthesis